MHGAGGARLLVPPDNAVSRWVGLDQDGRESSDLDVVDVIGVWNDGDRITVQRFEPVADPNLPPGYDNEYWQAPGDEAALPTEIHEVLDRLPRTSLDIDWIKYSVSRDGLAGWLSLSTSRPDDATAALSDLPRHIKADLYPRPWTLADQEYADDVVGALIDDDLAVACGGHINPEGHFVTSVEPILETQELLDRLQTVHDGCITSHPWITTEQPTHTDELCFKPLSSDQATTRGQSQF